MVRSEDEVYLRHILESGKNIEQFLTRASKEEFDRDKLIQNGFIRELEVVGEAARRISVETRSKYSDVPWENIFGMRNRLVHDYLGVDLKVVWSTSVKFVPELVKKIKEILEEE